MLFRKKAKENWDALPEMVVIPRALFENLIEKEVVCRFISDMNQGLNGNLHLPASWLIEARPAIEECVKAVLGKLDEHSTDLNKKVKLVGIEKDGGEWKEVKA